MKSSDLHPEPKKIYANLVHDHAVMTDRIFLFLFIFQFLAGLAIALWISPLAWVGDSSRIHEHVYAAVFLGFLLSALPVYMCIAHPGASINMDVNALAQSFYSILFIHLTGGRIETHFHVFVSLAFLASYRNVRPILIMSVFTALDHILRGYFWPESIYGTLSFEPLRVLEHISWVVFEDVVLGYLIMVALRELKIISLSQWDLGQANAKLQVAIDEVERLNISLQDKVHQGKDQLLESRQLLERQKHSIISSSKMVALGEMAGGIAHEINNPLGVIHGKANLLLKQLKLGLFNSEKGTTDLHKIVLMTERISKIVTGLRFFSRQEAHETMVPVHLQELIENTLSLCVERFKANHLPLRVQSVPDLIIDCHGIQIEQVLLNLLNNAYDAVESLSERWVDVGFVAYEDQVEISVTDSGSGIPSETVKKMMELFFTTKSAGKGTGLGLSISKGIVEAHGGSLRYEDRCANTRFVVTLPRKVDSVTHKDIA